MSIPSAEHVLLLPLCSSLVLLSLLLFLFLFLSSYLSFKHHSNKQRSSLVAAECRFLVNFRTFRQIFAKISTKFRQIFENLVSCAPSAILCNSTNQFQYDHGSSALLPYFYSFVSPAPLPLARSSILLSKATSTSRAIILLVVQRF